MVSRSSSLIATGGALWLLSLGSCGGERPPAAPPASARYTVTVSPETGSLLLSETIQLRATVRDEGRALVSADITWSSSNPAVARVSEHGSVEGLGNGEVTISAAFEGARGSAAIEVTALVFESIEAGFFQFTTCGLLADGRAYCWGNNDWGQLGIGTDQGPEQCPGRDCSTRPRRVQTDLRFTSLALGSAYVCGVAIGGAAYCWGNNASGDLGVGDTDDRHLPTPVVGGLTFRVLAAGAGHTCGITTGNDTYCWGGNTHGSLGTGVSSGIELQPQRVVGGHVFTQIDAGFGQACGLAATGRVYCWGINQLGETGTGSSEPRILAPTLIDSPLTFQEIELGAHHGCALATTSDIYCWGTNEHGQLGAGFWNGPEVCIGSQCSRSPIKVAGGPAFASVSPGGLHTCGISTEGSLYCWGSNFSGQLGIGTVSGPETCIGISACSTTPVPVQTASRFAALTGGSAHTCALALDRTAYCWGQNDEGQLGNLTTTLSSTPIRVFGQP